MIGLDSAWVKLGSHLSSTNNGCDAQMGELMVYEPPRDGPTLWEIGIPDRTATLAEVQVRMNDPNANRPIFTTGLIGRDNSIARHGSHGLHWLYDAEIQGSKFVKGDKTLFLTQPRNQSPF
ncbi:hypothetical protein SOVF_012930 [Spinacia oleracea]|nr:hypothetical protein SOVF_012930 [Spinacia oleracea]